MVESCIISKLAIDPKCKHTLYRVSLCISLRMGYYGRRRNQLVMYCVPPACSDKKGLGKHLKAICLNRSQKVEGTKES